MFLSRLEFEPRSRRAQNERRDTYELHRTLSRAWTENLLGEEANLALVQARVLFRAEDDEGRARVLVQSKTRPDWSVLRAEPRFLLRDDVCEFDLRGHLHAGQQLRFRLVANPTRCESDKSERGTPREEKRRDGKRRGLYREWERLEWLARKAALCGFRLPSKSFTVRCEAGNEPGNANEITRELPLASVTDLNDGHRFPLPGSKGRTFSAVQFDGVLEVTDCDALLSALQQGVGTGKGFGFGLLSLSRSL